MTHTDIKELTESFWSALDKSRTVMLGTLSSGAAPARPMTAQVDEDIKDGSIYFFASRSEGVGREVLAGAGTATFAFQSKNNDLLASAVGPISAVNDQAMIDKLWSAMASVFYEHGKDDPNLLLLRFQPGEIEVWQPSTIGYLKAVAYKLAGHDAGKALMSERATIPA